MRRTIIPYNPRLKARARELRQNMTRAEAALWKALKGRQLRDYDFDRQRPLDEYIVDFYCKELMLAIEVDGASHRLKDKKDRVRQKRLESLGIRFLRFTDASVLKSLPGVVRLIENWIEANGVVKPTPDPSEEGRKK